MANFEIDEDQAALIRELRKLETSDPVHANVYNALFEKLINNDAFLERLANKMIEKSMLCHVLDSVNAQQVLAADVGPKITAITNELKENVSVLNTKKVEMPGGKGRVNISNNYVAPSDGWVRLQVNGTGNGSYIQLLSNDGYANTVIGFSSGNVVNGMLPLRKGATFTYVLGECTLSAAQFYPC